MTGLDLLRVVVAALAALVAGGVLVIMLRYLAATWRNQRKAPGRILARHVSEVSGGTLLLVLGFAWAMYVQLDGRPTDGATARLWMYLAGMALLLLGVVEVGHYQRRRR